MRELYEIRLALECAAVPRALPNLTDEDLREARASLERAAEAVARGEHDGRVSWFAADREFHRLLARRTGNRRLEALIDDVNSKIRVFQDYGSRLGSRVERATEQHRAILDALEGGSADEARAAMERHITENERLVLAELAQTRVTR